MNKRQADALASQIERADPQCKVTGIRRYDREDYILCVTDTRTGYGFTVSSPASWDEKRSIVPTLDPPPLFEDGEVADTFTFTDEKGESHNVPF